MITIANTPPTLTIHLSGAHAAFGLRRTIALPYSAITRVAAAPEMIDDRPRGFRFPGTYVPFWPGPVYAGQYWTGDGWAYWNLIRAEPSEILRINLAAYDGSPAYRMVVVQTDDAAHAARGINGATA